MAYELKWSKEKNKYIKIKKRRRVDELRGVEEEMEVPDSVLREYIKNEYFRINDFNKRTLLKELPISRRDRDISVEVYADFLDDYINRIQNGRVPEKSYYIAAPDSFGKKVFAYQVIKECLAHGLKPTPILSAHVMYNYLNTEKYEEFYGQTEDVDVAIITTGGAPSKTSIIVLKTLLEHCERIGVPLLILSRFSPDRFYDRDPFVSYYLGVRQTVRGDYGKAELKGFNREKMYLLYEDAREELKMREYNNRKR